MANDDLTAKLRIDGDGSGASKAVDGVEKSLDGLGKTAKKVDLSNVGDKASAGLNRTASSAEPNSWVWTRR